MAEQIGTLEEVFQERQVTEKFKKREFILKITGTSPKFDQFGKFQLVNDKVDFIDNYQIGDKLRVSYSIEGRKSDDKYYTNLNAFRIEKMQ